MNPDNLFDFNIPEDPLGKKAMCTILLANEYSGLLATVACRKRRGFTESGVNSNQNQFFIHRLLQLGCFLYLCLICRPIFLLPSSSLLPST